jgi:predicted O-methyltransferase YrrM
MPSVHRQTFAALVKQHEWAAGAELGVDKGILFGVLLKSCPQLHLIGVDTFPDRDRSARVFELAAEYGDRATVIEMNTHMASRLIYDGALDFVFIDADHSYEAVRQDIKDWQRKVKPGGWVGGHDYSRKFPGVVEAVDRAFSTRVQLWPGTIWGVWV